MSFITEKLTKCPRTAKRCYWCDQTLPAGEPRVVVSGIWEGFFSDAWHPECHEARKLWQEKYGDASGEWPDRGDMARGGTICREEMEGTK